MTNAKDAATAAQGQQPTGDDNGIAAAAAAANAEPTEPTLDDRIKEVLSGHLDQYGQRVKTAVDQAQGRAQQFYGEKLKEDRGELAQFMGDLTQVLDPEQQEALDALRERRRIESVDKRLKDFEEGKLTPQAPAAAAAPAAAPAMSQDDANALYESVDGFIEASGLDIKPSDEAVWKGYTLDMPLQQAVSVARKNIKAMRTAAAPAPTPAATPATAVPPTTAGAESIPAQQYDSLSDLAAAFRDREINSIEYSRIARDNDWLR